MAGTSSGNGSSGSGNATSQMAALLAAQGGAGNPMFNKTQTNTH
jgi:hypothetical protein